MTNEAESNLIRLIAIDRLDRPISSMSGKLKRRKSKLAPVINFGKSKSFDGDRAYGRIETSEAMKAKGMRDGVEAFSEAHPKYGAILQDMISEERQVRNTYLHFGMQENSRLSSNDYMAVMTDLGFSETRAEAMYSELMTVSRNMARKRDETERSILVYQSI